FKVLVLAAATMIGSVFAVGFVIYIRRAERRMAEGYSGDAQLGHVYPGAELRRDTLWFGTKAVTGYGAGVALQSVASLLPASSVTIIGILSRLVSGFSTTVTNALLPRLVNARSSGKSAAQNYCYVVLLFTTLVNAALMIPVVLGVGFSVGQVSLAIIAVTWIGGSSASAVIQRLAIRFHSSVASWVSIVVSIAVPASLGIILVTGNLNLLVVVVGFVLLDVAVGLGTALLLKEFQLSVAVASAAAFGLSVAIGIQ
ncbi:MAG: hypothetical protein KAH44_26570, partial [Oricola sp.]|nr:hypothetical protein [Oricola sp.]